MNLGSSHEDQEFRDVFDHIFQGGYIPPCHKLVNHNVLSLSTEGRAKVCSALKDLFRESISPCIAGDIWSEGGVAIFGILVYWLTADDEYKERLLGALPFSVVRHTADELVLATKRACASMGVGTFIEGDSPVDTVSDSVHATTSDSASNIVSGWKCFDGHECNCHIIALAVTKYLESPGVGRVFKKLRGMTTHFNHSVIGRHLLHDCQTRYQLSSTSPPQDNATRGGWKGAHLMAEWYFQNQPKKAATVVDNPDGSKYGEHQLTGCDWDVVRESTYVLSQHATAIDLLQVTKTVTVSSVLPVIGGLISKLDPSRSLKYNGAAVAVLNTDVQDARKRYLEDLKRRYYNELMTCKLEDFSVSTFLDPRYKSLAFKHLEKWDRGTLTKDRVIEWARSAYTQDWKPARDTSVVQKVAAPKAAQKKQLVSFLEDSDDEIEEVEELVVLESIAVQSDREFTLYLASPPANMSDNPVQWWVDRKFKMPNMFKMFRQFIASPASTGGVERTFSACGHMHSNLRKRVTEGTLEHSMMASINTQ
ncbi:hypothetical protein CYMTET_46071 [Cymbomonas tetramitiformis]|uniref:HAT C-terminal dimerisation domain-containing protein n=1 Tax=Cymbomonas tetramitiformis TaxID=36881 RepID=A0AAE0BYD8_9CHLO|nr:hypothetical protein CYMTET_46071 [Cymbomonas tetramitiformis]